MKSILKTVAIILALFGISAILGVAYYFLVTNFGRDAVLIGIGKFVVYSLICTPALIGGAFLIGLLNGSTADDQ